VKLAVFSELYLTYKLILRLAGVFGFLPMTVLLKKFVHPCYTVYKAAKISKALGTRREYGDLFKKCATSRVTRCFHLKLTSLQL